MDSGGSKTSHSAARSPAAPGVKSADSSMLLHEPKRSESNVDMTNNSQHEPKRSANTAKGKKQAKKMEKTPIPTAKPLKSFKKPSVSEEKRSDSESETEQLKNFDTRLSFLESSLASINKTLLDRLPAPSAAATFSAPGHTDSGFGHTVPAEGGDRDDLVLEYEEYDEREYNQPGPSYRYSGNDEADISHHSEPGSDTGGAVLGSVTQDKVVPALAAKFATQADVGPSLHEEIANSTLFLMNNKLEEKVLDDTAAKYLPPANCATLDAPKVNQTIWDNLSPSTRSRDLKLSRVQKLLTRGITAFAQSLLPSTLSDQQQDALALLANANYEMNALRKDLIKPEMNSAYNHLCKASTPVTKFLFGDDLGKRVKDMKEEQRAAVGVVNSRKDPSRGRARAPYHPYAGREYSRAQYKVAGWNAPSNRPNLGSRYKPFLDKTPYYSKQRRQPQGQIPDRRSQPPPQNQGRLRPTSQHK